MWRLLALAVTIGVLLLLTVELRSASASHPFDPLDRWADLQLGGDGSLQYNLCTNGTSEEASWGPGIENWDIVLATMSFNPAVCYASGANVQIGWNGFDPDHTCPNNSGCEWNTCHMVGNYCQIDWAKISYNPSIYNFSKFSASWLIAISAHEWGHAMGLADDSPANACTSGTLMSLTGNAYVPNPLGGACIQGPTSADLATVKCYIYSRCRDAIGLFSTTAVWGLKNGINSGVSDYTFSFGNTNETPVSGDWDGNGTTTIGTFNQSTAAWSLRNSNSAGSPSYTPFVFGSPGDRPVVGDWDHNGTETIGVFHQGANCVGEWNLRNSIGAGPADIQFSFGNACTDKPIVGDWNGDGTDTIGVFGQGPNGWGSWAEMPRNCGGSVTPFYYGSYADIPITGDWNADGIDTVGTGYISGCCEAGWSVINYNQGGPPSYPPFAFGSSTD
jgi:hypothetical protein